MFGFLFEEEEDQETGSGTGSVGKENKRSAAAPAPPFPRGKTGLCGLQNQGATCYLNSLIQTLFFTPEFRESLFQLGASELGNIVDKDSKKVRVIPLQLQRVFTQLLLINQESISTACLTESFGWTGAEGSEQHDIQELNRILFSAIETSLVGTSGKDLIRKHYHGTSVTKVICQQCGNTSEREEDYLDLPVTLIGCSSLEESLQMLYIGLEVLEGRNQYRCESCDKLVDAIKSAKLRTLPSVLTFNLLRFSYDFQKGERFKETKRYTFPLQLNMDALCESESFDNTYELYSVIIHGGSCYGGHYHAYIRDLEGLGSWSQPEKEEVKVLQLGSTGRDTVVSCDNPVDLMRQLLIQLGGSATLDQLCQNMSKQTGLSWNKRYKKQYGPLTKFFKKHSDVFSCDNGWISLRSEASCYDGEEKWIKVGKDTTQEPPRRSDLHANNTRYQNGANFDGHSMKHEVNENFIAHHESWFDFNDSRVSCIKEKDIQSQFAGRESAYMLFYRRKNSHHSATEKSVLGRLKQLIPVYHVAEVDELNKELEKRRDDYDIALNQIRLTMHFSIHYTVKDGALVLKQGISTDPAVITLDRRKSVEELRNAVRNFGQWDLQGEETSVLHTAKELPAGMHLYQEIQADESKSLMEVGIYDGTKVFVWNGREVDGYSVRLGIEHEPLLLTIAYSLSSEDSKGIELQEAFPKSCTLGELKVIVAGLVGMETGQIMLSVFRTKGRNEVVVEKLSAHKDRFTLSELQFYDGEKLTAERRNKESFRSVLAVLEAERLNNLLSVVVEVRCLEETRNDADPWPVLPLSTTKDQLISDLKLQILKETSISLSTGDCCLRIDDDVQGRGPPLYEHLSVEDTGVKQGHKLVLEPGTGPKEGELAIQFQVICKTRSEIKTEIIMEKRLTINQCLQNAVPQIKDLEGNEWHLRKTNWLGEPAQVLFDQDATLEDEYITNGDILLIEQGRLPPKGFIRLSLWISSSVSQFPDEQGVVSWITSGIQGLLGTLTPEVTNTDNRDSLVADELQILGEVEIGQDATLYDLKMQICTLPLLCENVIPTPGFLRLQELVDGYPMRVFRNMEKSLRHLKISSSTQLFVKMLQQEENLSQSAVLLNVSARIPGTRTYHPPYQVVFDPRDGATPASLGQFLADSSGISSDRLGMAKYFREKYLWLPINTSTLTQRKKKGGKKSVNLRHAPVHLQDGDVIGVKDLTYDPLDDKDDFSTPEHDEGREKLKKCEEEKRKRRKRGKKPWSIRSEVQLKIHVDDFR